MSEKDRKAIVDLLQGAAFIALSLWIMPKDLTLVAVIPIGAALWGAHKFDRGCKNLKDPPHA